MFPDAEVDCREKKESRKYILNKVVCDRERDAKICRTIPWYVTRVSGCVLDMPCSDPQVQVHDW